MALHISHFPFICLQVKNCKLKSKSCYLHKIQRKQKHNKKKKTKQEKQISRKSKKQNKKHIENNTVKHKHKMMEQKKQKK